jgi:hypothetical protein
MSICHDINHNLNSVAVFTRDVQFDLTKQSGFEAEEHGLMDSCNATAPNKFAEREEHKW